MSEFFTLELLIRLITSAICSCAFGIIFKINKRHLITVGVSGLITYFIYHTVIFFGGSAFVAAFASTFFTSSFGEVSARINHAPAIIYLLTGLIPIVPGGDAYYSMRYLLSGDMSLALEKLSTTAQVALGIAGGIVLVSVIFGIIQDKLYSKRK